MQLYLQFLRCVGDFVLYNDPISKLSQMNICYFYQKVRTISQNILNLLYKVSIFHQLHKINVFREQGQFYGSHNRPTYRCTTKNIWFNLCADRNYGAYFSIDNDGGNVTSAGYQSIIQNFLMPKMQEMTLATAAMNLMKNEFNGQFISHIGPVKWPPRSCDLTPLDYFH